LTTAQLRKTDTPVAGSTHPDWRRPWYRSCDQVQSRFCACVHPSCLDLRWPRSHPRQTTKTSPVPFFGRRRRRQVRTQNLSEPRSGSIKCEIHANTPKPQCSAYHQAALRFTLALASLDLGLCLGRPFAAKTSSQPAPRESRERPSPQTAGEGPLPGGGRPPQHPTRHHEGEWPASVQSRQRTPRMAPALVPGHVSGFSPGLVHVSGAEHGPALAELPETEREDARTDQGAQRAADGPLCQRQRHCRPGRFLLHGAHSGG